MKIGLLIPGHPPDEIREPLGEYADMYERLLAGHGFDFARWEVVDNVFPEGPEAADGWLIGGSRHGVYESHDWIAPLEELVRAINAAGRPLVGICFGHQIIAQALGGKVEKYPGGWAVGRTLYDFDGTPLTLNAWHQDQIVALPAGAEVIASNDLCRYAGIRIDDRVLSVQPHPEYTRPVLEGLLEHRAAAAGVPPEIVAEARANLDTPTDAGAMADRIAAFFKRRPV
ncbi:MAG TPA: glutamine amidotransferase [Rhodobacteraceae bacterium]|nr:glutamine amidotransferase [Paracoccaceae bacterium]